MTGRRWTARFVVVAAVLGGTVLTAVPAVAQAQGAGTRIGQPFSGARRPLQLDVHAGLSWWGWGAASGFRFGVPIVRNGFVRSINNAVYINFGADFYWVFEDRDDRYRAGLGLPVTLHWEFFFTPRWSAFAELGVNVFFHPRFFEGDGFYWSPGHWFIGAIGGRFFATDWLALTLRLGSPYSSFGVSFFF